MKKEIINKISDIVTHLHNGKFLLVRQCIGQLKNLLQDLPKKTVNDIQDFVQQVLFEMDYDSEHRITEEIRKSADRLIQDLGYSLPKEEK
jgi:hypothetical protein